MLYRGSYTSAYVLLNLSNELGKKDKMRGLPSILSLFRNEFDKFNITRARILEWDRLKGLNSHPNLLQIITVYFAELTSQRIVLTVGNHFPFLDEKHAKRHYRKPVALRGSDKCKKSQAQK